MIYYHKIDVSKRTSSFKFKRDIKNIGNSVFGCIHKLIFELYQHFNLSMTLPLYIDTKALAIKSFGN